MFYRNAGGGAQEALGGGGSQVKEAPLAEASLDGHKAAEAFLLVHGSGPTSDGDIFTTRRAFIVRYLFFWSPMARGLSGD